VNLSYPTCIPDGFCIRYLSCSKRNTDSISFLAGYGAAPIDLCGLFEFTNLHELMHTVAAGVAEDISPPGMVGTSGWNAATNTGGQGWNDAQTLAFMGMGSELIQLGFAINQQGNLRRTRARSKERSLPGPAEGADEIWSDIVERKAFSKFQA